MYSYKTLKKIKTIISSKNSAKITMFGSYSFNHSEIQLILGTNFKQVYCYSCKGTFYVYNITSKIGKEIQEPTFSLDKT